jgi:hypothetical protein
MFFDPTGLVEVYNVDGVSIHAFPKGDGNNESARRGPHGDYHLHINPSNGGPKKIVRTVIDPDTGRISLIPEDASKLTKKELKVLGNMSESEGLYLYKSCREVFHNNGSEKNLKRLKVRYVGGPLSVFMLMLTDNSHTRTCDMDLTGQLGDICE